MIPFFSSYSSRYDRLPKESCADAGYGSEENYSFMDANDMEAYVKYNYFHKEQKKPFKDDHQLMRYKQQARDRLTSEKGLKHRSNRPIEPEAVFGQMKYDMHYKRFRHFGKDKVTMDSFFATAFNMFLFGFST